jgi:hypothetical protein
MREVLSTHVENQTNWSIDNTHCHSRTHVEHVPNRFGYTMMVKCDEGGVFNTH